MVYQYPIEIFDGHLVIQVDNSRAIIDTGAPFTVSNRRKLIIGGREFDTSQDFFGITPATLSGFVGTPMDTLLGMDILSHFGIEIKRDPLELQIHTQGYDIEDDCLSVQSIMGLPSIAAEVKGRPCLVVFDTGAKIAYLPRKQVAGLKEEETIEDFYPSFGHFSTPVYKVPFNIGGHELILSAGVLPELLELTMLSAIDGVIGTEILQHLDVNISMQQGVMRLAA